MADLERQTQDYYEYSESGWTIKRAPRLDSEIVEAMNRFGRSDDGRPLWRFNWGGAAIIRDEPFADEGRVTSDCVEATQIVHNSKTMRPMRALRYLKGRRMAAVNLCYKNRAGRVKRVKGERAVPKWVKVTWWEYEYVDFGVPRWYLERLLTAEQLVAAGLYDHHDIYLPRQGDYIPIMKRETTTGTVESVPVEDNDGRYFQPDMRYVELVREHVYEEENVRLPDLLAEMRAKRERLRARAEEERELREFNEVLDMVSETLREPVGRVFSLPSMTAIRGDVDFRFRRPA